MSASRASRPADAAARLLADEIIAGRLQLPNWDHHVEQWLLRLKQSHAASLRGTSIDHPAYVVLQVYFWLIQARYRHIGGRDLLCRLKLLSLADWLAFIRGAIRPEYAFRLLGRLRIRRKTQTQALWHNLLTLAGPKDIREFAQWLDRKPDSPA